MGVAEPEASPEEESDVDGEECVGEEGMVDAQVESDGSAEVAGEEDGSEDRGGGDEERASRTRARTPMAGTRCRGKPRSLLAWTTASAWENFTIASKAMKRVKRAVSV